jgi:hypothetical protein
MVDGSAELLNCAIKIASSYLLCGKFDVDGLQRHHGEPLLENDIPRHGK